MASGTSACAITATDTLEIDDHPVRRTKSVRPLGIGFSSEKVSGCSAVAVRSPDSEGSETSEAMERSS